MSINEMIVFYKLKKTIDFFDKSLIIEANSSKFFI